MRIIKGYFIIIRETQISLTEIRSGSLGDIGTNTKYQIPHYLNLFCLKSREKL